MRLKLQKTGRLDEKSAEKPKLFFPFVTICDERFVRPLELRRAGGIPEVDRPVPQARSFHSLITQTTR